MQTSGYEDGVSKDEAEEGEVEDLVKEMAEQVIKVRPGYAVFEETRWRGMRWRNWLRR